ncbi:NAD(+)--rifampin ADP-ribosyltransferase [Pedobacter sp. MC2016-05]|nr:NAD(+)--rifampin ADP-ribosyltransferase [Pedobacter sp. MC2016-05]MCX2473996.1 NAD(+)--rifampin ADP-ribosyltransferase [Pedobacter sp. MC2016-05]
METIKSETINTEFIQTFFHGTKGDLKLGDLIKVGLNSNYGQQKEARFIYLSATLNAAVWGQSLL